MLIGAGLLWVAIPVVAARDPAPPDLAGVLKRIQTTCFDIYPQSLLRKMSGRSGPVPDDVRADPRRQVQYLKKEEMIDKGLFYPSILEDLLPAFTAVIRPGSRFLDLGSGDGRVVFLAALLGARAHGIEYDRRLHGIAVEARRRLADVVDADRALLERGDFFLRNFSSYDVLFYYGSGAAEEDRLLGKLRQEMSGSAVLILAYPPGAVPGFRRLADYEGIGIYRPERQ